MKKLLLGFTLTFGTLISHGQLTKIKPIVENKVGDIKPMGIFIADLTYNTANTLGDTTYTLTYHNGKYTTIDDYKRIKFKADTETINTLYSIFADAFSSDDIKNYEQTITLGKNVLTIKGYKTLGIKGVQFYVTDENGVFSFMNPINKGQLDNLFGRTK